MSDGGHDDGENATDREGGRGRRARVPRPLNAQQLNELGLAYVARFATSAGRLDAYLKRKLRERGWEGEMPPDHAGVVARMVELGYVDDRGFAQARAGGMLRRGFGARRISETLARDGIAQDIVAEARGSDRDARAAAAAFARRRRLGPFGRGSAGMVMDRAMRDKQLAAMLRAGHTASIARKVIEAADVDGLEQWVDDDNG